MQRDSNVGRVQAVTAHAQAQAPGSEGGVLDGTYRMARRIGVAVVGSTVLLIGVVLLVTPGPAFVVIPVGLGILSLEFAWARRWLDKLKAGAAKVLPSGDRS